MSEHRHLAIRVHRLVLRKEAAKHDMKSLKLILPAIALVAAITVQGAQTHNSNSLQVDGSDSGHNSIYPVERITKAVNYAKRSAVTRVDFQGTPLLAASHGEATVQNTQSRVEIAAEFDGLVAAMRFGPEYLTYVTVGHHARRSRYEPG